MWPSASQIDSPPRPDPKSAPSPRQVSCPPLSPPPGLSAQGAGTPGSRVPDQSPEPPLRLPPPPLLLLPPPPLPPAEPELEPSAASPHPVGP
ncbi:chitin-binding lectin 1-like [Choloepus didactylus]|uniref:chitin-binding lectin 1-like n=1 Tax=Choloepus didactylus TaxID=27675 RepID=UPI00189FFA87|nr:chitin-binding lectin 1-like [Choloepus didactylus]